MVHGLFAHLETMYGVIVHSFDQSAVPKSQIDTVRRSLVIRMLSSLMSPWTTRHLTMWCSPIISCLANTCTHSVLRVVGCGFQDAAASGASQSTCEARVNA
jgi:hypothetical protein